MKSSLARAPEPIFALFALLLHFAWEMLQAPLWVGMAEMAHWRAVHVCTLATLGDVLIALAAFWVTALIVRSRQWALAPRARSISVYVVLGLALTIGYELIATGPLQRWEYAQRQPTVPLIGVGLAPIAQWLLLPLVNLWLARRHLLGVQWLREARDRVKH